MNSEDFHKLPNFTEMEVGATGADFKEVQLATMETLQAVRTMTGRAIFLIKNGLTTGKHTSHRHPAGEAVDFKFGGYINPIVVVSAMLACGFKGVGVYKWSCGNYTFHGDTRPEFGGWYRETDADGETHTYALFNDKLMGH
jgi:hypothetical protein